MNHISIAVAFIGGFVSFVAPCVLPLIPGFLAYLAGSSLEKGSSDVRTAKSERQGRRAIFLNSVFFVFGFSVVFAALGVLLNSVLEHVAYDVQLWLSRVGGAVVIIFGLYLVRLLKIPFLEREYKFSVHTKLGSRYLTSFIFGAAFAAGWTPCVGAVLGSILGLAIAQPGSAFALLFAYSLGLGLPFLLVGLFAAQASQWIERHAETLRYVNIVFGILLIMLGILVFTQQLSRIANFDLLNRILLKQ